MVTTIVAFCVLAGSSIAVATQSPSNDARADVTAALIAAKKGQKHVLLNFGADWCAECRLLDKVFADSTISQSLKANFVAVGCESCCHVATR